MPPRPLVMADRVDVVAEEVTNVRPVLLMEEHALKNGELGEGQF